MHTIISSRNACEIVDVLDFDVDNTHTPGISLAGFPILGLLVPVTNGTPNVTVEISIDGSNWYTLLQVDGSTEAISIVAGGTAFFVNSDAFTPLAAYASPDIQIRLKTSVAQTADRTFTWLVLA